MINKLYQNIAAGLKQIKSCKVYQEDVPQNFERPSFMLTFYDQNSVKGINGCRNVTVHVDVLFFPKDRAAGNEECWQMAQNLSRELRVSEFKIRNRNFKITDGVLHFLFDVDYREYQELMEPRMRQLSGNTGLKEV